MKRLRVMMTRREIVPEQLSGSVAVVLDVILATTTLVTIFENGARRVYVAGSVEESERICSSLDSSSLLRGGEQGGFMVEGYDLGPFPEEYSPEVVSGRDVVFVTTNGTRALAAASDADQVLVGSMRNAPAVAKYLDSLDGDAYLICAGSRGHFGFEDFAGAAEMISKMDLENWTLGDSALLALDFAERYGGDPVEAISRGRAGRWFSEDYAGTIRFAAEVGASKVVPELKDDALHLVERSGVKT
ncbi:MAG: 2-phosphosulfolactate phosphatase [Rubrobacteraceae bacterium]